MPASIRRPITDDLLAVMVQIKREAGVGYEAIQAAVDQFACQQRWEERTGGIGFPLVEDIPEERRDDFMAALAQLAPEPQERDGRYTRWRGVSAAEIWPSRVS